MLHEDALGDEGHGSVLRRTVGGFRVASRSSLGIGAFALPRRSEGTGEDLNSSIRSVSGTGSMAPGVRCDGHVVVVSVRARVRMSENEQHWQGGRPSVTVELKKSSAVRPADGKVDVTRAGQVKEEAASGASGVAEWPAVCRQAVLEQGVSRHVDSSQ